MLDNHTMIFFSLLFSFIGIGFYYFGKKRNIYFQLSGLVMMIFPYFTSSLLWMVLIGILIFLAPFLLDWFNPI